MTRYGSTFGGLQHRKKSTSAGSKLFRENRKKIYEGGHNFLKVDYEQMLKERLETANEARLNGGGERFARPQVVPPGAKRPGAEGEEIKKEMSASAKKFVQQLEEEKKRKEAQKAHQKEQENQVVIKQCHFYCHDGQYAGWIDAKGRIFLFQNQCIGRVDPKTGKIICGSTSAGFYSHAQQDILRTLLQNKANEIRKREEKKFLSATQQPQHSMSGALPNTSEGVPMGMKRDLWGNLVRVDGMGNKIDMWGNRIDAWGNKIDPWGNKLNAWGQKTDAWGNPIN